MTKSLEGSEFSGLRTIFWPVHLHERKKLIAMLIMAFLIPFDYSILRNIKDTVVITAIGSSAEVIPFIKVWAMLPMAILVTWLFTKLATRFKREHVFYMMISGFLTYFLIFAFILYPNQEALQATSLANSLREAFPKGGGGFIAMVQNWNCTFFYAMAELWSSMVISVLFWGFANDITTLTQAKRFYGLINVASCFAAFAAGQVSIFFTQEIFNPKLPFGSSDWEQTFSILILIIFFSGLVVMMTYRWMHLKVLTDPTQECTHALESKQTIKNRKKLCLKESLKHIAKSKYLICIAVLVVSYNLGINLIEVAWKSKVRELYPASKDFNLYLNQITSSMGFISTIIAFSIPFIISRLGWTFMALITPVIMLITAIGFFGFSFLDAALNGFAPLIIAIFFGSANNVLSKASKYSVFDASKEMAFIPLLDKDRLRSKAAIDGIGSRLGKSGGSLIQQGLLLVVGSLAVAMPWIAGFLTLLIIGWIIAIRVLGKEFKTLSRQPK
jgi:ATP:ADP antiporter, AAA family